MHQFRHCVSKYQGNYRFRSFSCLDQFLCMAFAQLSYRESLRDMESCLQAMNNNLYHIGNKRSSCKKHIRLANKNRGWRISADFAQFLIISARQLYADHDFGLELEGTLYAFDASKIEFIVPALVIAGLYRCR